MESGPRWRAAGKEPGYKSPVSEKNGVLSIYRWVVEKVQFFAERGKLAQRMRDAHADAPRTVKAHLELASTFLTLRGAQEIAERRIADPKDRERFVALVREAIAGSIQKGQPLPTVRPRDASRSKAQATSAPLRHVPFPSETIEPDSETLQVG